MAECTFSCPNCHKQAAVQTYGGMSDIYSLNCTKCPTCVHIDLYDPTFSSLYMRLGGYTEGLNRKLEMILKPCECGGTFSAQAPYRCPHCLAPFSRGEVVEFINDPHVGRPVMSRSVHAADYWEKRKDKLSWFDLLVTKVRVGQMVLAHWAMVLRSLRK